MPHCRPSCIIPPCRSGPVVSIGSSRYGGYGYGYGDYSGYGSLGSRPHASILGGVEGVVPSCSNQLPATVIQIDRPAFIIGAQGPILAESCEGVYVGGNTPCASLEGNYSGRIPYGSHVTRGINCYPCA